MRWPLITRRRHVQELHAVHADRERLRGERDQFREDRDGFRAAARTAVSQLADARETGAANLAAAVRTAGRNNRLTEAEAQHDADLDGLLARVERALRSSAYWRTAHSVEARRADQLQARLDDYLGLNSGPVLDGRLWQHTRPDKPREVKPS